MSMKCFKLMLLVVVFSVGVAFAAEPVGDSAPWFSNGKYGHCPIISRPDHQPNRRLGCTCGDDGYLYYDRAAD